MRQIQVLVPEEELDPIVDVLSEEEVDYVRQRAWVDDEERWLLTFPVPTDAIGYLLGRLEDAGIDVDRYTVVSPLETAMTPRAEPLMQRFASDFDPLSVPELRSQARDLSHDLGSFLALVALSAVIATAGLVVESFAVVVGSMVIAPIVGPVLTAAVGATTGDRSMLADSVRLQAVGLAVAIIAATGFSFGLRTSGFVPGGLDVTTLEPIAVRIAPGLLTLVVGVAAGVASAVGLVTKGPSSVIGVMIAAALIPAAATVGIAAAWVELRVAAGALLLLLLSAILINLGAGSTLALLGYRPEPGWWRLSSLPPRRRVVAVGSTLVVVALVVAVAAGSVQQLAYERTVNREVEAALAAPEHEGVEPVAVRIEYGGVGPFAAPETVTVTTSRTTDGEPPPIAGEIARRIRAATGDDVSVRVRFLEFQRADATGDPRTTLSPTVG